MEEDTYSDSESLSSRDDTKYEDPEILDTVIPDIDNLQFDEDEEFSDDDEDLDNLSELSNKDNDDFEDDEDEDEEEIDYGKLKFSINKDNYINKFHKESEFINNDEALTLSQVIRDNNGTIIDDFHKFEPIMTKYELSNIIGQRAAQLENGSEPYIKVGEMFDSIKIAELELKAKILPFIIKRSVGTKTEYWNINDLELIHN